jgi:flagellar biosynthesis protein FliQ
MDWLVSEGAQTLAAVAAPFVLGLLAVGTTIGVLQATTQVNDPALGAVPRIAVVIGIAVSLGGWIVEHLAQFLSSSMLHIAAGASWP